MEPPAQLEPRVSTQAARSLTDKWRSIFTARPVLAAAIPGSLIVVGVIDYATGFELLLSFFYLGPVALCAWHFGRRSVIAAGLVNHRGECVQVLNSGMEGCSLEFGFQPPPWSFLVRHPA